MGMVFRAAAALELLLVAAKESFHLDWLPLAGGHLQQIGVVFILAFAFVELSDALRAAWPRRQ